MKEWLYCLPVAVFPGCLLFPFGVGMLPPERIRRCSSLCLLFLSRDWNYNPRYLYRYGATLNYLGLYGESTKVLTQCSEVYNSYDLQMLLADNYYAEGMLDATLTHSIRASEMCPGRFRPLYMQMVVYDLKGQSDSALRIAADLSVKPVKVPSATVEEIRSRANECLMKAESAGNPKDTLRKCGRR